MLLSSQALLSSKPPFARRLTHRPGVGRRRRSPRLSVAAWRFVTALRRRRAWASLWAWATRRRAGRAESAGGRAGRRGAKCRGCRGRGGGGRGRGRRAGGGRVGGVPLAVGEAVGVLDGVAVVATPVGGRGKFLDGDRAVAKFARHDIILLSTKNGAGEPRKITSGDERKRDRGDVELDIDERPAGNARDGGVVVVDEHLDAPSPC